MLVLAQKCGRLGNRLSLFAHLIACSREFDLQFKNFAFFEYADLFKSTCHSLVPSYPAEPSMGGGKWSRALLYQLVNAPVRIATRFGLTDRPIQIVHLKGGAPFDLANEDFIAAARSRKLVVLRGWGFRCHDVVTRHADAIRAYFRPIDKHQQKVDESLAQVSRGADVVVGVHIRQGDYASFKGGELFFDQNVYRAKMEQVEAQLSPQRVRFLVCSDGSLEPGAWGSLEVQTGPGHMLEDMYALSRCDFLMGPVSTFSHWSSFIGNVPLWHMRSAQDEARLDAFVPFETL